MVVGEHACRHILQAQVDADGALTGSRSDLDIDDYVEVPAAASVLTEAGRSEFVLRQPEAVPDLEVVTVAEGLGQLHRPENATALQISKGLLAQPGLSFPALEVRGMPRISVSTRLATYVGKSVGKNSPLCYRPFSNGPLLDFV